MKALYFVLASFQLSLAAPAVPAEADAECACPMPLCPASQPERCECQNAAISACWANQLSEGKVCPAPALKDCGPAGSVPTSTLPTSPVRAERAAAPPATCSCEPIFCAQIWPQSCRCANSAKVSCYQSCGGAAPALQNCGDTPEQSAALYGAFAQPSQSAPVLPTNPGPVMVSLPAVESTLSSSSEASESTLSFERPSTIPTPPSELEPDCQCEPTFCVASWPAGCHCQNRGALDCYDKCGGTYPTLQDCGADPNASSPSNLEDFPQVTPAGVPPDTVVTPQAECQQCQPVFCAQSWPLSCQCSNQAASDCAQLCGRPTPQFLDCNAADPESLDASLPELFDMIPDPSDIPIIFTNLIADLPDPLELPEYLENLPDYINDLTDDEPWSETHTWYSFYTPAATSAIDQLASNVAPAFTDLSDAPLTFPNGARAVAAPSITEPATESYHICGHRAAVPCPTGYNCVRRPGASCGPELDCGGYCVDVLNGLTLLAEASSTQSNTTTLEFSQITDFYPTNTLLTSRRGNLMLPPRQVAAPEPATTEEPASTATSVFPPIPCGEGYPPCDPGLQCVDIFVSGIGFAEKRSYCAAVSPGDASAPSSPAALAVASSAPSLDDASNDAAASPTTHYPWPDIAWPGPITTLYPMFGPGPVGLSNYHPSTSAAEEPSPTTPLSSPASVAASSALPALAPAPNGGHPAALPFPIVPPPVGPGPASPSASAPPAPAPLTMQCGGPANETCPTGFTCVRDLDAAADSPSGGCGPACGEPGVCIIPAQCSGFAGIPCSEPGRTCVDDPSDDCDPLTGGADCMGICV